MPLSAIAITEIDKILNLCDATTLTQAEIDYLNAIGEDPQSQCAYYLTTQTTLIERSKYDSRVQAQLDVLAVLAGVDNCPLTAEVAETPAVNIPFFAGAIR